MKKTTTYLAAAALVAGTVLALGGAAYAQSSANTTLEQEITTGALHTDIVDASGNSVPVGDRLIEMDTIVASASQETTTGSYGEGGQRVLVSNLGAATGGWNLSVAAADGATAVWEGPNSQTFDYRGVSDAGVLTIDASAGTIAPANALITQSGPLSFSAEDTSLTLVNAPAGAADVWEGYIEGMDISQIIPAGQEPGVYQIDLMQTIAAN